MIEAPAMSKIWQLAYGKIEHPLSPHERALQSHIFPLANNAYPILRPNFFLEGQIWGAIDVRQA